MENVVAELSSRVRTFICGLSGHDLLLSVEPGRLSLRCTSCPYETPGWTIKESLARPIERPRAVVVERHVHSYV